MTTRLTWLALLATFSTPASAQGLSVADLVPELLALDQRDARGAWVVTPTRVDEIEARLTAALLVPPPLEVSLVRAGTRLSQRYSLGFGNCTAWLAVRDSGVELVPLTLAVDGEHVLVGTLPFAALDGDSTAARHALARGFPLATLPGFLEAVVATLPSFRRDGVELVVLEPQRRLEGDEAGFASLRYALRLGDAEAHLQWRLPVAGGTPEPGPSGRRLDAALDTLVQLAARLEFDFPHAVRLGGRSHREDDYTLLLSARARAQQGPTLQAAIVPLRAEEEGAALRWVVMGEHRAQPAGAMDLTTFVALTNGAVAAAAHSEEVLAAFGVLHDEASHRDLALAVTVPTRSLWDARGGHVHLLSCAADAGLSIVEREELRAVVTTARSAFDATSVGGHRVRVWHPAIECTEDPASERGSEVRYRELVASNLVLTR